MASELIETIKKRPLFLTGWISLLIHFLLLYWFSHSGKTILLIPDTERINKEPERRIAFEIVETPDSGPEQEPDSPTNLISDRQSRASDLHPDFSPGGVPFSDGLVETKGLSSGAAERNTPGNPGNRDAEHQHEKRNSENPPFSASRQDFQTSDEYAVARESISLPSSSFSMEALMGTEKSPSSSDPPYNQKKFSAEDLGGIRFNTYNWEWAPYLLELKRRIQRNIYPPPAFTQLGFGGINMLRFRIYPSGKLEGPDVLGYQGEKALVETSVKAVEVSAPFNPLPEDFPEKYLEVTARFDYFILTKR